MQLGESLRDYDGILTGMPTRQLRVPPPPHPGLTEPEGIVLEMVRRVGAMTPAEVAKQSGIILATSLSSWGVCSISIM